MTKSTEQRELKELENQLKQFGTIKRDRKQAAATYHAVTGKPLSWRERFGFLRPMVVAAALLIAAIPFVGSQNQVGGLFGKNKPTASPTSDTNEIPAKIAPATPAPAAEPAQAPAASPGSTTTTGSQAAPAAAPVAKPVVPVQPKASPKPKRPVLDNVRSFFGW